LTGLGAMPALWTAAQIPTGSEHAAELDNRAEPRTGALAVELLDDLRFATVVGWRVAPPQPAASSPTTTPNKSN